MAELPDSQHLTSSAIFSQYEKVADFSGRPHMGASELGYECDRYLWLSFRWAKDNKFNGRMLRLFQTGQLQEQRLVDDLRSIGIEVSDKDDNGNQHRFSAIGGHFGGSMDGAGVGFPEAPKTWHVLEFKTSNAKGFNALVKKGVKEAKPQHWTQMQLYMGWAELTRAMYIVVNKDTDDIYNERIEFDQAAFDKMIARAEKIIRAPEPAITIGENADCFTCKFCRFRDQCYHQEAPKVSCRTCAHSTPEIDGNARWSCDRHHKDLTVDEQRAACADHRHIPDLLKNWAEIKDLSDNYTLHYINKITNAEFNQPGYTSKDITECQSKEMIGNPVVTELISDMGGEIINTTNPFSDMADDLPWVTPVIQPKKARNAKAKSK